MRLSGRSALLQSAVCLLLLALSLFLESGTNLDMLLQRRWFDAAAGAWLIDPAAHQVLRVFFYDGMKRAVACIGLGCAALFLWGYASGRSAWMRAGLLMALSCAATPLLVAALRAFTGIHCPRELIEFGGAFPYRHFFPLGAGTSGGRCFPGGHASGGFALTMVFFCVSGGRKRVAALLAALAAGWVMGLYQMLRGEHFLSHTVVSMLLAWQMNIGLVLLTDRLLMPALERRRARRAGGPEAPPS